MMLRFLLSMFIMLQGQMVICADAPGAPGPVATGPHFFQYSKRLGGYDFVSQQVNATYPKAYMDAEKYAGTSDARINQYILQPLEYKSLPTVNFEFQCPGHSFLVGVFSNGYISLRN